MQKLTDEPIENMEYYTFKYLTFAGVLMFYFLQQAIPEQEAVKFILKTKCFKNMGCRI